MQMSFSLTAMGGSELHLYIDSEWCGYLDFDAEDDAQYVMQALRSFAPI